MYRVEGLLASVTNEVTANIQNNKKKPINMAFLFCFSYLLQTL